MVIKCLSDDKIDEFNVKGSSEAAAKIVLKIVDELLIKHSQENRSQLFFEQRHPRRDSVIPAETMNKAIINK